ncbi:DNA-binding protein [Solitalea longa]|uniref:DNA-binding protein n=1 Tax=Solitalea longa TaxID=2079460 RepID=A0A2S4ZYR5_9SPHI|nr:helix-turn-helix domain-containing protein [Solitalea longa]POY35501.1 DNA-binding protein [Solitalea longa]
MEAIILTKDQYETILNRLDEINQKVGAPQKDAGETFIDNSEFLQLLKISKRTAQTWRDEGKISFSQIGNKIYYKLVDVQELLRKHYNKSFKPGKF